MRFGVEHADAQCRVIDKVRDKVARVFRDSFLIRSRIVLTFY